MNTEARDQYPPDIRFLLTDGWLMDLDAILAGNPPPLYRLPFIEPTTAIDIVRVISQVTGVKTGVIRGNRQSHHIVFARHLAVVAVHELRQGMKLSEISIFFNYTDKHTIRHILRGFPGAVRTQRRLELTKEAERRLGCRLRS